MGSRLCSAAMAWCASDVQYAGCVPPDCMVQWHRAKLDLVELLPHLLVENEDVAVSATGWGGPCVGHDGVAS